MAGFGAFAADGNDDVVVAGDGDSGLGGGGEGAENWGEELGDKVTGADDTAFNGGDGYVGEGVVEGPGATGDAVFVFFVNAD